MHSLTASIILIAASSFLAAADYGLKERAAEQALVEEQANTSGVGEEKSTQGSGTTASTPRVVKKGTSTKKQAGVDVHATLNSLSLSPVETNETSILKLIGAGPSVQTVILLYQNDRAALFSWVENDDVKTIFSAVKKALQEQFSPKLKDLVDNTVTSEDGPPVDILSFSDPAINAESILFIRVRNRLYEFHRTEKNKEPIDLFIEALMK